MRRWDDGRGAGFLEEGKLLSAAEAAPPTGGGEGGGGGADFKGSNLDSSSIGVESLGFESRFTAEATFI